MTFNFVSPLPGTEFAVGKNITNEVLNEQMSNGFAGVLPPIKKKYPHIVLNQRRLGWVTFVLSTPNHCMVSNFIDEAFHGFIFIFPSQEDN